jgi:hypothetical protein
MMILFGDTAAWLELAVDMVQYPVFVLMVIDLRAT